MIRFIGSLILDGLATLALDYTATHFADGDTGILSSFVGVEGLSMVVASATLSLDRRRP